MSVGYRAVQWSRHKLVYDAFVLALVLGYIALFMVVGSLVWTGDRAISPPILMIRALGTCSLLMLHVVLAIGPLTRLDPRFLPLLYNRRHLGVATFLVALAHGALSMVWYHGFGVVNPLLSLLTANTNFGAFIGFPFQLLGLLALLVLFVMAATSHDFWNANLGPRWWKRVHMLVYAAYALVVLHVALGAIQSEGSVLYPAMLLVGAAMLVSLHLAAALKEARRDADTRDPTIDWVDVCAVDEIEEGRARRVSLEGGEDVAVFKHEGSFSALSGVCRHQGGPLAEGKIIDGCVTCPWHGWQYKPGDGCSPPPFEEKLATYEVRVEGDRVQLNPTANAPGTPVRPARAEGGADA